MSDFLLISKNVLIRKPSKTSFIAVQHSKQDGLLAVLTTAICFSPSLMQL